MSEDKPAESAVVKLEHIHADDFVVFTSEEADALKEVAAWYRKVQGAVALGGVLGTFMKWLLLFVAFMAAVRAGLLDWLSEAIK